MKTAREWQEEEDEKDDGENVSQEFIMRVQSDAIKSALETLNARSDAMDSDRPTAREADIMSELGSAGRDIAALDPIADEKETTI